MTVDGDDAGPNLPCAPFNACEYGLFVVPTSLKGLAATLLVSPSPPLCMHAAKAATAVL